MKAENVSLLKGKACLDALNVTIHGVHITLVFGLIYHVHECSSYTNKGAKTVVSGSFHTLQVIDLKL